MKSYQTTLNEAVQHNDLRGLVSNVVSIDQYKSKIGYDKNIVVVAIEVNHIEAASDLSQFIETGHKDALDVDVSVGPTPEGKYTVFIEYTRSNFLFRLIDVMLQDILNIDNEVESWKFVAYKDTIPKDWTSEEFEQSVHTSSYEYVIAHDPDAKVISERIKFLNSY
tara:strand:+ start:1080 stop:1577 length:498 start_codon:yes stop_codon:yes gene_type:complete